MSSKRLTKQEMREDQFRDLLSEFYFGTIRSVEDHWQAYLLGLVVLLGAVAGGFYLVSRHQSADEHDSFLLSRVIEAYNAPVIATPNPNPSRLTFASETQKNQEVATRLAALERAGASGGVGKVTDIYQALTLAQSGKYAEAEKALAPLVSGGALQPLALQMRARIREAQGQWDQAEADWKQLTALHNSTWSDAEGWWLLGSFYERRQQKDKAEQAYEMVAKSLGPDASEDNGLAKRAKDQLETLKGKA